MWHFCRMRSGSVAFEFVCVNSKILKLILNFTRDMCAVVACYPADKQDEES